MPVSLPHDQPPNGRCWHCNRKRLTFRRTWVENGQTLLAWICNACWLDILLERYQREQRAS